VAEKPEAEKKSHAEVKYEEKSTHLFEQCRNCAHFIRDQPPRCEGVKSPIAPGGWCIRYSRKH